MFTILKFFCLYSSYSINHKGDGEDSCKPGATDVLGISGKKLESELKFKYTYSVSWKVKSFRSKVESKEKLEQSIRQSPMTLKNLDKEEIVK